MNCAEARDLIPLFVLDSLDPGAASALARVSAFSGGLTTALILSYEGRSRFVRDDELERWSLPGGDALALAVANPARRSTDVRFETE